MVPVRIAYGNDQPGEHLMGMVSGGEQLDE
jgi:hypothetical protein